MMDLGCRWIGCCLLVLTLVGMTHAQLAETTPSPADRDRQFAELAKEAEAFERAMLVLKRCAAIVKPSVVHIEADKLDAAGRPRRNAEETGSGFLIELQNKYYVVTNRHVIRESAVGHIRCKLHDGRIIAPKKISSDASTDIAVLEVTDDKLVGARFGDSDRVEIADFVLAIGSPFNLTQSVTLGIVSAKGRRDLDLNSEVDIQDFIQTDAAINPGNSGGPLVNLRGEIIGMNTAIASQSGGGEGFGFAIPSNIVKHITRQLIEKGVVTRGYLGVTLDHNYTPTIAQKLGLPRVMGARVLGVTAKSPAEEAKFLLDDVILQFNGIPIDSDTHLVSLIGLTEVAKQVPVVVWRKGEQQTIQVILSDRGKFDIKK
jgi:serine protease Do